MVAFRKVQEYFIVTGLHLIGLAQSHVPISESVTVMEMLIDPVWDMSPGAQSELMQSQALQNHMDNEEVRSGSPKENVLKEGKANGKQNKQHVFTESTGR